MQIVLLQAKIAEDDIQRLPEEFPQFLFLSFNERTYKQLSKDDWEKIEKYKKAWEKFQNKMADLRKRRHEILVRISEKLDHQRMEP